MNTATKLMLAAIPAMLAATPAMASVSADSKSLDIHLNGEVASKCELGATGSSTRTLDMSKKTAQELVIIGYSCNSPYTVTLTSLNGGMKHNSANFKVAYDVIILGLGSVQTKSAASLQGGFAIDTSNNWTNIILNGDAKSLSFDLNFNGLTDYQVAGSYNDKLTVAITADL